MAEIAAALARGDLERIYREMEMIDFSKDVLSLEPRRFAGNTGSQFGMGRFRQARPRNRNASRE